MKTVKAYLASELKKKFPEGFENAHNEWQKDHAEDLFWIPEIVESLKALFEHSGVYLYDYSISEEGHRSYVKFNMDDSVFELSRNRAIAWIENNLLNPLRIPFTGEKRWSLSKYGSYYRAGMIPPCPLTGVCYDEDLIESLLKDIKSGESLGDSYRNLADKASQMIESEIQDQMSESYFVEHADANEYHFTKDGTQI